MLKKQGYNWFLIIWGVVLLIIQVIVVCYFSYHVGYMYGKNDVTIGQNKKIMKLLLDIKKGRYDGHQK